MSALVCVLLAVCHVAFANKSYVEPEFLDMLRATGQDELFANLMGISDVNLVRPKEGSVENTFSNISPLGDILLTPEQEEQARQGIKFTTYPGSKWRNNVIPYFISLTDFTPIQRITIDNAINALDKRLKNLRIRNWRSGDEDYVVVISGRGCYSNLGRIGGEQTVSLQANSCLSTGTIQHEFIHAAGFLHEHMRPDRDNYVRVLWDNIPDEWKSQYNKANSRDFGNQESYDYYSVMHYSHKAPGTNKPAFEIFDSSIDPERLGQRDGPTETDVKKVDTLYM